MSLDAFLATPRAFLDANILFPPGRGMSSGAHNAELRNKDGKRLTPNQSGVFEFVFVPSGTGVIQASGKECPAFRVENPDNWNKQHPRFRAYFCSYSDDEIHLMVVGKQAGIMLTPRMNGCSFGVGSATDSGERVVMHANKVRGSEGVVTERDQEEVQTQWIMQATGGGGGMIGPSRYKPDPDTSGTTIGVRDGKDWSFCTQSWKMGKPSLLLGVTDFA